MPRRSGLLDWRQGPTAQEAKLVLAFLSLVTVSLESLSLVTVSLAPRAVVLVA